MRCKVHQGECEDKGVLTLLIPLFFPDFLMLMELEVETPRCLLIQRRLAWPLHVNLRSHGPLRKDDIAQICATAVVQEMLPGSPLWFAAWDCSDYEPSHVAIDDEKTEFRVEGGGHATWSKST